VLTRIFIAAVMASMLLVPAAHAASDPGLAKILKSTADHSKFKALQQVFNSGPEVTKACLSCHTEASKQLHKTQHWRWSSRARRPTPGQKARRQQLLHLRGVQ